MPVPPLTVMVTVNACTVVMLDSEGIGITDGEILAPAFVMGAKFEEVVYVDELAESGVYAAVSVSPPTASEPAGTIIVAAPPARVVARDA